MNTTRLKSYSNPFGFVSLSHVDGNCYLVHRPFDPPKMCLDLESAQLVFHSNLCSFQQKYYESIGKPFKRYGTAALPRENR